MDGSADRTTASVTRARSGVPGRTARPIVALCACAAVIALAGCGSSLAPDRPPASPATEAATPLESVAATPSLDERTPRPTATGASAGHSRTGLPDHRLTPGARDPAVTQATIDTTVCRSGWSKSVRPPVSYTGALKRQQIIEYGYADRDPRHYQEDHLIPLSLGGAPRDPRNLWPQPLAARLPDGTDVGAGTKDGFELHLHAAVCDGTTSLAEAQQAMATDWVAAWEAAGRP